MNKFFLMAGVAAIGLSLAAPAHAQTTYDRKPETAATGFYLGGYGGYDWTDADDSGVGSANLDGGDYGVFAGYEIGRVLDQQLGWGMHGALEGFYGWSSSDDSSGGLSIEKDHEWGVSFRPGFDVISSHMPLNLDPYAIVGYRRTQFTASTGGVSASDNFDGFELGLGTELVAYGDIGVRVDYSHVFYETNDGVDPDSDNLRLGVAYHF